MFYTGAKLFTVIVDRSQTKPAQQFTVSNEDSDNEARFDDADEVYQLVQLCSNEGSYFRSTSTTGAAYPSHDS